MRKLLYVLMMFLGASLVLCAQEKSIIDELNQARAGEGEIRLLQDESISELLGLHRSVVRSSDGQSDDDYIKVRGWKIQVFSGNGQESKSIAEARRSQVKSAFPELEAIISYNAPVWRLRAGNFLNRQIAEEMLQEMKQTLPSLAKEMYLVQEVIKQTKH